MCVCAFPNLRVQYCIYSSIIEQAPTILVPLVNCDMIKEIVRLFVSYTLYKKVFTFYETMRLEESKYYII